MKPMKLMTTSIYRTPAGKAPFNEWITSLPMKAQATIDSRISRVRDGNLGDVKNVGGGVFELRVHLSPGYRVYFGLVGSTVVLLLCGGSKRGQQRDIKKAQGYLKEFLER